MDKERYLWEKILESVERNAALLEKNNAILEEQMRVVREINDRIRKIVINTSN
ncbi:MAG TPA: hypothetical protein VF172_11920 [Nitrososphaera sp.]